jgi:hypothetical protein
MASYGTYKKVLSDQFLDGAITTPKLVPGAGTNFCTLWIFNERGLCCQSCANNGGCVEQANGRCCLWTAPANVSQVTFEIWSGGGGGAGHTCCNCCSFSIGGAGGNYATKTIAVCPGWQYTVCAGGSWPCNKSHICDAGMGCRSFVNGCNLSNFCVTGGCGGWMCNGDAWGPRAHTSGCANCNICGYFGADFGMMGTTGFKYGTTTCRCHGQSSFTGQPPIIGRWQATATSEAWCSCGCYVNWPSGGGMSGSSSYCGNFAKQCAGGSGQGGSGIVRISMA